MRPEVPDPLIELRCSVVVLRPDAVLLIERVDHGDWVLPGGRPHSNEGIASCVRRETLEETGLEVYPSRCAFVLEVNDPIAHHRITELVFVTDEFNIVGHGVGEPGRRPTWVRWADLDSVRLHPPIAHLLPGVSRGGYARYLGDVWSRESSAPPEIDRIGCRTRGAGGG